MSHILLLASTTGCCSGLCHFTVRAVARSEASFALMARSLKTQSYRVQNLKFSTHSKIIAELVSDTIPQALKAYGYQRLHFVIHSLGGIMARAYLVLAKLKKLGHVVMLGPPNKGSKVVDVTQALAGFEWVSGPADRQLSTDPKSPPNQLPSITFSLGIISGRVSFNPLYSSFIQVPDDGNVSVESTRVEDMHDQLMLPMSHTFMMNNPLVIAQVQAYLKQGALDHSLTLRDTSLEVL